MKTSPGYIPSACNHCYKDGHVRTIAADHLFCLLYGQRFSEFKSNSLLSKKHYFHKAVKKIFNVMVFASPSRQEGFFSS
jgi:hypothetical protein